ncbi:UNVERIFIED_CONTAM: hypothetical protein Sradi_0710500 [Sesamum radiatum]|uniref:Uncharacterized protein n=1 Tax=Sesamum radiatum TaxID=300843 RepID=A0AAW2VS04_SESRA
MNARFANKVRVRKGTIPENVLLELENTEVAGSSTPSDRNSLHYYHSAPVMADPEGPNGRCVSEVPECPPLVVGESKAVQGEPRKSQKRKRKSKSRSKSRRKSKSRSSRSTKSANRNV